MANLSQSVRMPDARRSAIIDEKLAVRAVISLLLESLSLKGFIIVSPVV